MRRDAPRVESDAPHYTKERAKRESRADRDDGDRHHETDARARMTRRERERRRRDPKWPGLGSLGPRPMIPESSRFPRFCAIADSKNTADF